MKYETMKAMKYTMEFSLADLMALHLVTGVTGGNCSTSLRRNTEEIYHNIGNALNCVDKSIIKKLSDRSNEFFKKDSRNLIFSENSIDIAEDIFGPKKEIFVDGHKYVLVEEQQ